MLFQVCDQIVRVPRPLWTGTQLLEPPVHEQPLQRLVEVEHRRLRHAESGDRARR